MSKLLVFMILGLSSQINAIERTTIEVNLDVLDKFRKVTVSPTHDVPPHHTKKVTKEVVEQKKKITKPTLAKKPTIAKNLPMTKKPIIDSSKHEVALSYLPVVTKSLDDKPKEMTPLPATHPDDVKTTPLAPQVSTPAVSTPINPAASKPVETSAVPTPPVSVPVATPPVSKTADTPVVSTPSVTVPVAAPPVSKPVVETPTMSTPAISTPVIATSPVKPSSDDAKNPANSEAAMITPATLAAAAKAKNGGAIEQTIEQKIYTIAAMQDGTLASSDQDKLKGIVQNFQQDKGRFLRVVGYVDPKVDNDRKAALQRVMAVRKFIVENGISQENVNLQVVDQDAQTSKNVADVYVISPVHQ
jgi:hypothetical protein